MLVVAGTAQAQDVQVPPYTQCPPACTPDAGLPNGFGVEYPHGSKYEPLWGPNYNETGNQLSKEALDYLEHYDAGEATRLGTTRAATLRGALATSGEWLARANPYLLAGATAFEICSAFINAGCWLGEKETTPDFGSTSSYSSGGLHAFNSNGDSDLNERYPGLAGKTAYVVRWNPGSGQEFTWEAGNWGCSYGTNVPDPPTSFAAGYYQADTTRLGVVTCANPQGGPAIVMRRGIFAKVQTTTVNFTPPDPVGKPNGTPGVQKIPGTILGPHRDTGDSKDPAKTLPGVIAPIDPYVEPGVEDPPWQDLPKTRLVPLPYHHETYGHYVTRLQTNGLVGNVTQVSDAYADPGHGPNEVFSVNPAPRTRVAPASTVDVYANPADAPWPDSPDTGTGVGVPPPNGGTGGITGPCDTTIRAIDLGPLSGINLGSRFPFGIFAWISGVLGGWTAGGGAPSWSFSLLGHPQTVDLSFMGSAMSIMRPVFLSLALLGYVWLLASFTLRRGS